jgi:trehalose 6-phosphate synthase
MHLGLTMPLEERQHRWRRLFAQIKEHDVVRWRRRFVEILAKMPSPALEGAHR